MRLYLFLVMLHQIRNSILGFIDFFHRPLAKWVDRNTFRYIACGGTNTLVDILVFFLVFHFLLGQRDLILWSGSLTVSSHIAAFLIAFSVSFPIGFVLSKYIVFPHSNIRGRIQLMRYALMVASCILLNYVFLHLFVGYVGLYPTPSKILTTGLVAIFSYISQRKFTFQVRVPQPLETQKKAEYAPAAKSRILR